MARRGPSQAERFAFEVVRRVLDVEVEPRDDGRRRGEVDAHVRFASGEVGAFEVTTFAKRAALEVECRTTRTGWPVEGLGWFWFVEVGPTLRLNAFRECLVALLKACERHGVTSPDDLVPTSVDEEHVLDWWDDAPVWAHGFPEANRRGLVDVVPAGDSGVASEHLDDLTEWLPVLFAEPVITKHVDKLNRTGMAQRHLYVAVHRSAVPFALWVPFAASQTVPRFPATLPDGLTHVWLCGGWDIGGVLWFGPDGWRRSFPFDPPTR